MKWTRPLAVDIGPPKLNMSLMNIMSLTKWIKPLVVDTKPLEFIPHSPLQVKHASAGDILGLDLKGELIPPYNPRVTEIGVVVMVCLSAQSSLAGDTYLGIEHLIFTNGDTYRRLIIPTAKGLEIPLPKIAGNEIGLSIEDRKIIKQAIIKKFRE